MNEPTLTLVQSKSLAEHVADSIVQGIASGLFASGQRIVEIEVAKQLGVSRVPVREALKILQAQGIVVSRPHYGVTVAVFDAHRIVQLYEVRCNLEKIAVRDACRQPQGKSGLLAKLDGIIGDMAVCLQRGDLLGVSKADLEFHHSICMASRNEIVIILWEALSRHMMIVFEQELLGDAERTDIVAHHVALRNAIEHLPPETLAEHIEQHIMRLRDKDGVPAPSSKPGLSKIERR